jgi:hypothetical protein
MKNLFKATLLALALTTPMAFAASSKRHAPAADASTLQKLNWLVAGSGLYVDAKRNAERIELLSLRDQIQRFEESTTHLWGSVDTTLKTPTWEQIFSLLKLKLKLASRPAKALTAAAATAVAFTFALGLQQLTMRD